MVYSASKCSYLIEKEDFLDYIDYVDNCRITFGETPIEIDQYIKRQSSTFKKVSMKPKSEKIGKNDDNKNENPKTKAARKSLFK